MDRNVFKIVKLKIFLHSEFGRFKMFQNYVILLNGFEIRFFSYTNKKRVQREELLFIIIAILKRHVFDIKTVSKF